MKEQYCKYSLIIILLILGVIVFIRIIPFLTGLMGAATIYVLVRKQMFYLTQKKNVRHTMAAVLMLLEAALCFLIPLSLVVWLLVEKIQNLNLDPQAYIKTIEDIARLVELKTGYNVLNSENISFIASFIPKVGQFIVGNMSNLVVNIFVMLFVLFFMLLKGKEMETYCYDILPFKTTHKERILNKISLMVRSNAIGIPLVAIVQGGVATIGYFIFDAPNPILFGFLSCFASVVPMVGIGLIWAPVVAYMFLTGNWHHAIGLLIYSGIITSTIDNLIRFLLQKKLANIHPLITIFGVIIGLSLFGFMGIIFGPLLLSIFLLCFDIFKQEYLSDDQ